MNTKQPGFFQKIGKANTYVVLNTFYAYFCQGVAIILLGAVLPALKEYYNISYQVGGMLMSVMFAGYALFGLLSGYLPLYIGMKRSFILFVAALAVGMGMLLVSGNPIWLLLSMFVIGISKGGVNAYNNQIVSVFSGGDAGPLNLLHAAFATGALLAPIIALLCSSVDSTGWRIPVLIAVIIAAVGIFFMLPMKLDNSMYEQNSSEGKSSSLGFFKEKIFIISLTMSFLYQFTEGSLMSWLTTYFIDSKVMTDASAQLITSTLWISLLAGRAACITLSRRMKTQNMLLVLGSLQVIFFIMLVTSHNLLPMVLATIGLGLGMSGMYGTLVANCGDLFSRYPTSMAYWGLISSLGATISPTLIGIIAGRSSMRAGFVVLAMAAFVLLIIAVYNYNMKKQRTEDLNSLPQ